MKETGELLEPGVVARMPREIREERCGFLGRALIDPSYPDDVRPAAAPRDCDGFGFWHELPREHCGEDVPAQLRVMARYGGRGLVPSGACHLELPTTVPDRHTDAPKVLACS